MSEILSSQSSGPMSFAPTSLALPSAHMTCLSRHALHCCNPCYPVMVLASATCWSCHCTWGCKYYLSFSPRPLQSWSLLYNRVIVSSSWPPDSRPQRLWLTLSDPQNQDPLLGWATKPCDAALPILDHTCVLTLRKYFPETWPQWCWVLNHSWVFSLS